MQLRVRIGDGEQQQPDLLWDSVWQPANGFADWAVAGADEVGNVGGLQAKSSLHTAVVLLLFTDRRIPDEHPLRKLVDDGDPRGWFGDGIDVRSELGEAEMGSLLWIFARAYLNQETLQLVEIEAREALTPLLRQRVAVTIDVQATRPVDVNRVDLAVQIYGRDGKQIYDYRFEGIWQQSMSSPAPKPFSSFPPIR